MTEQPIGGDGAVTDREQKIAEIREAKKRADAKFEYATEDYKQADDWLEILLSEIDRLREEREKLIEGLREIEDESSREDADTTNINGIAQGILQSIGIDV